MQPGGRFNSGRFNSGRFNAGRFGLTPGTPALPIKNYWSIQCLETQNSGWYGIRNIEFRGVAAGPDLTAGGGTAISGADRGTGKTAAEAFDDPGPNTYWGCDKAFDPAITWVGFNLTTAANVVQVALTSRDDTSFFDQMPREFNLRWSDDGTTWTTVLAVTGEANWTRDETRVYNVA